MSQVVLRLSELQAFVVGDALTDDDRPEAAVVLAAIVPPASPEDLACVGSWSLVIDDVEAGKTAWYFLVEHANGLDAQLEAREGRGRDAEGRAFLRAELRSLQGLTGRIGRAVWS